MEVFEYYGQLAMPDEIKKQLDPKTRLRVMIFLEKDVHIIHGHLLRPSSTPNFFWRWLSNMERRWESC